MAKTDEGIKVLAVNRKARFNYEIQETFECGMSLVGTEVKSIKDGRFSFADAYGSVEKDELYLVAFHVTQYAYGNRQNHEPDRRRKLLVHKKEIKRLRRVTDEKGLTLVPLRVYLRRGLIKCEIGIARGKKLFDKRDTIRKRDQRRELERDFRTK